ncbi:4-coumarate--CoA ligase family protein [Nocardia sp. NPDC057663]|uniref:4-coumarate--CoA ligase family protein n=1 Tax=Nocardia sp. NPDC057663 TaxID=3346201 RepID=UPI0036729AAD
MSFRSPYPDVEIPDTNVYDFLFAGISGSDLDRPALIDSATGDQTTYRTLIGQIDRIAGALAIRGLGVGDVVALHSPNTPAFAAVLHGILRAGGTVTTVSALSTAEDIAAQLIDSGARLLFTVAPLLAQAAAGARIAGIATEGIVVLDGADGYLSLRDLLQQEASAPDIDFDPATQLAILPYSSGTTGHPKGVMLTHRNLVANVCQIHARMGIRDQDRVLAVLPFFHIYGITAMLHAALYRRAALVTMPRFDFPEFLHAISRHRCTYVFVAPPIAVALAKHPIVEDYDLSSVHTVMCGAAPLDTDLGNAVARRLACRVRQGYGMTEMSPVSHAIPDDGDDFPIGSVGVTSPNMECKLVDPTTGREVDYPRHGLSAPGELWCKGPNVMVGYLGNPAATAEALDEEGYLHTGDIAVVDGRGAVYIIDRLKELIKYKGYQVPPAELEALLLTHPEIVDAAVIGALDAEGEEIPKAFVVRRPGSQLDERSVISFVAEQVSPYKKVRQVEFIDAVPKSAAGKILRKDLRARDTARSDSV